VEFVEGLPDISTLDPKQRNLVIIDDLMDETDGRVTKLFTKKSHHMNTSVVYIVQNLFPKNKESRTISLNAQYIVMFKNPRDASQVTTLAKQMNPGQVKYLQSAFDKATSRPYGYLLVDLKQDTPEKLRMRTKIFPHEFQRVYIKNL
jgi:ABC-type methionine transport system ATPase subunit